MAKREMTWHEAIKTVLAKSSEPLNAAEITERIVSQDLRESFGATPADSVGAAVSTSIKNERENSPYRRVGRGLFVIADSYIDNSTRLQQMQEGSDDRQAIAAFGMYWQQRKKK